MRSAFDCQIGNGFAPGSSQRPFELKRVQLGDTPRVNAFTTHAIPKSRLSLSQGDRPARSGQHCYKRRAGDYNTEIATSKRVLIPAGVATASAAHPEHRESPRHAQAGCRSIRRRSGPRRESIPEQRRRILRW